jgi:polyhydroxybutyrate depolymerase
MIRYSLFFALGTFLLAGCNSDGAPGTPDTEGGAPPSGGSCHDKSGPGGVTTLSITEPGAPDGGVRSALVHVPPNYDATKPTTLVLNIHGLIETNALQEQVSHMSDVADARNFIVVYPEGTNGLAGLSWNAGTCCGNTNEDVTFIRDLVKRLEEDYCIDPKRVYATGLSNGGMMSYRLACDAADVFAAVAPVAGAVVSEPCTPSRPVPILAVHGTGDTIVPFNGGTDGFYHLLNFPPVSYSVDLWRSLDSCSGATRPSADDAKEKPGDSTAEGGPSESIFAGSTVSFEKGDSACHTWSGCSEGSEVELCTVVNGGHGWPGGLPLVGKTSTDLDATTRIIDFFEKHPMK